MEKKLLHYYAVFQQEKDGGYSVWVPALPGCSSQGETFEAALTNIQEAIALYMKDKQTVEVENARQFIVPVSVSLAQA